MKYKIKHLRELRNFTQSYVAEQLSLSLSGYSKIERNETDISVSRLGKIAEILDTDLATLLNFNSSQVFNQYNNKMANVNGVVQNQQLLTSSEASNIFESMSKEISALKSMIEKLSRNENV